MLPHSWKYKLTDVTRREIPNTYHIVVLGSGGVGKSCLTGTFTSPGFHLRIAKCHQRNSCKMCGSSPTTLR